MRTDRILPAIGISILAAVPGTVLLFVLLKVAWWLPLLALVVGLAGLVAFLTTAGSSVHRTASAIALWLPLLALAIFIAVKMLGFAQSQGFLPGAVSAPAATVQPSGDGAQVAPPAVQETEASATVSNTPEPWSAYVTITSSDGAKTLEGTIYGRTTWSCTDEHKWLCSDKGITLKTTRDLECDADYTMTEGGLTHDFAEHFALKVGTHSLILQHPQNSGAFSCGEITSPELKP